MNNGKSIRVYDYVNKPYKAVRQQLIWNGTEIFSKATKAAASQVGDALPELRVSFRGIEVSTAISIKINSISESEKAIGKGRVTSIELEWEAAKMRDLFPLMKAELRVYPLTASETQLELSGNYEPPFGLLGSAVDDVAGNRIAEASVQHFITDVAVYLRDIAKDSTIRSERLKSSVV
jgi:hypothetical protein